MTIERGLRLAAGTVIIASVMLSLFHHPYWILLTMFAGLNLFQSALTNWCPMVWILARAGLKPCVVPVDGPAGVKGSGPQCTIHGGSSRT